MKDFIFDLQLFAAGWVAIKDSNENDKITGWKYVDDIASADPVSYVEVDCSGMKTIPTTAPTDGKFTLNYTPANNSTDPNTAANYDQIVVKKKTTTTGELDSGTTYKIENTGDTEGSVGIAFNVSVSNTAITTTVTASELTKGDIIKVGDDYYEFDNWGFMKNKTKGQIADTTILYPVDTVHSVDTFIFDNDYYYNVKVLESAPSPIDASGITADTVFMTSSGTNQAQGNTTSLPINVATMVVFLDYTAAVAEVKDEQNNTTTPAVAQKYVFRKGDKNKIGNIAEITVPGTEDTTVTTDWATTISATMTKDKVLCVDGSRFLAGADNDSIKVKASDTVSGVATLTDGTVATVYDDGRVYFSYSITTTGTGGTSTTIEQTSAIVWTENGDGTSTGRTSGITITVDSDGTSTTATDGTTTTSEKITVSGLDNGDGFTDGTNYWKMTGIGLVRGTTLNQYDKVYSKEVAESTGTIDLATASADTDFINLIVPKVTSPQIVWELAPKKITDISTTLTAGGSAIVATETITDSKFYTVTYIPPTDANDPTTASYKIEKESYVTSATNATSTFIMSDATGTLTMEDVTKGVFTINGKTFVFDKVSDAAQTIAIFAKTTSEAGVKTGTVTLDSTKTASKEALGSAEESTAKITATSGTITATYEDGVLKTVSGLNNGETFTIGTDTYTASGGADSTAGATRLIKKSDKALTQFDLTTGTFTVNSPGKNLYAVTDGAVKVTSDMTKDGDFVDATSNTVVLGSFTAPTSGESATAAKITAGANANKIKSITITGVTGVEIDSDAVTIPVTLEKASFTHEGGKVTYSATSSSTIKATAVDEATTTGKVEFTLAEGTATLNGATITGQNQKFMAAENGFKVGTNADKEIKVVGDSAYNLTVAGDTGNELSGIGAASGVILSGDGLKGGKVTTDSVGAFTFDKKAYTVAGDNSVEFTISDTAVSVSSIGDLTGTVTGDFTTEIKVNDKAVNVTGDKEIGVVGDGSAVTELNGISNKATVISAGGATKAVTDGEGRFTFGTTGYNVGGDSAITFLTDANGNFNVVDDLTGTIKTTNNAITINGDEVSISGLSDSTTLTYAADALGIAAVTGLTNNATVTGAENAALNLVGTTSTSVATSLTANGKTFELLNDRDGVTIQGGSVVTGLGSGASLIADSGTYTINNTVLNVEAGQVVYGTAEGTAEIYSESATKAVEDSTAENISELATAAGIDTSNYKEADDSMQSAINNGTVENLDGDMSFSLENENNGTQSLDLSDSTGAKNVTLKDGDQEITFNDENGNVAQIGKDAKGDKTINFGNGETTAVIAKGTKANATVNFGRGAGKLISGANVLANLAFAVMATFRAVSGALMTVTNYDARNTKSGIDSTFSNVAAAITNGLLTMANGVVNTGEGSYALNSGTTSADLISNADADDAEGATVFNIYNTNGKMQRVGFTHNEGGAVDLSDQKASVILQGNASGAKSGESTLLGGSGNDTIFAGSSDIINAGAGTNKIILNSGEEKGAVVEMSETGRNSVDGFNYGFDESSDAISVDTTKAKITVDDSGNVVIKNGRAKTTLTVAAADTEENNFAEILIVDGAETLKTAVAKEGNVISVSSDEDNFANNYIGDKSGLSFSEFESAVNLNLAGTSATFGDETVQVSGINSVQLGETDATVYGSAAKETITAGSGNDTIWSSGGKDLMSGFSGEDKNGSITFGFLEGDGKDTITNFNFLTADNAQTADKIFTTDEFIAQLNGNDVILKLNNSDILTVTEAKGKNIQLSENGNLESVTTVLQVSDTLLTYDGIATKYIATGKNAAVSVAADTNANIWLNDTSVYEGKIKSIDATKASSAVLVGNSLDNIITGSAEGSNSVWGGDSTSNDTLIGGNDSDVFFYGVTGGKEGNDSISGITEDDTVNLFGIQLADISDFDITNSTIALKFSVGGSLTMANNGQTFMLANDQNQRYIYDKENSEWTKA